MLHDLERQVGTNKWTTPRTMTHQNQSIKKVVSSRERKRGYGRRRDSFCMYTRWLYCIVVVSIRKNPSWNRQLAIANPQYRSWKKEWIAIVVASIGLGEGLLFTLIYSGQSL
ncbi:hypothetical protein GAYE_SCF13G3459 [Galdieria yellowstonensis]|uniref:Uncharacterized protein n=1 Tax=Galdieria yellowstonensis TaxID=3028027 RepID=A0AAV9IEA7_9RHOD|nr:hypothetical protein GAYE_SCF13G3459 [Galdieria yellowstonensis]